MDLSRRQHSGSEDTNTGLLCDSCLSAGDAENAESYCVDCHEFLCLNCTKVHRRHKLSKDHQLLGHDEMPRKKMTEHTCRKHDGNLFDYFCKYHDVLCCSVCLNLDHRQCAAEYITDLVERFEGSGEYKALSTKIKNLDGLIGEIKTRTDNYIKASIFSAFQLVSDIKKFRVEINVHLDSLEKQILEKIDQLKNEDIQEMSVKAEDLDTMKAELDAMTAKMEGLSKTNCKKDLVIATKLSKPRLNTIENRVCKLTEQYTRRKFQFCPNNQILDMLKSTGVGTLEEKKQSDRRPFVRRKTGKAVKPHWAYNVKHQRDINIKHIKDETNCHVSGSVVMDTGRLAIADWNNDSVKVVDTQQGNILSYTRLSSWPFDITYTDQNQLVVTTPDIKKLIFLDVGKTLTVNKELNVYGECHGIDYTNNRLIVSFMYPGSVKILNMDGDVLSSIINNPIGKPLFSHPYCVISNADSSSIYVSDYAWNTVIKLDITGRVTCKYPSSECMGPHGIVVDQHDNLFIARCESSTVCILSAEGRKINTIKVNCPLSVALCEDTDQLFLSQGNGSNSLSVYKLH